MAAKQAAKEAAASGATFGLMNSLTQAAGKAITGDAGGVVGDMAGNAIAGAAVPIVQQGVSIVNARNDESVTLALLSQLSDDGDGGDGSNAPLPKLTQKQKLKKWSLITSQLSLHQVSELRKIIVNLTLPERFESFMHEEQIPQNQQQDNQNIQDVQQKRGSQPKNIVKKFTRFQKDYELVTDPQEPDHDFRIDILEMLFHMDEGVDVVDDAVKFVKSMIAEFSAIEKAKKQAMKAGNELYRFVAALRLGSAYDDKMSTKQVIEALRQAKDPKTLRETYAEERKKPALAGKIVQGEEITESSSSLYIWLPLAFIIGLILAILSLVI